MKPRKLLSAAALSAGMVAGCGTTPEAPIKLQRLAKIVEPEALPADCGCTAGNGKVPRHLPPGNS